MNPVDLRIPTRPDWLPLALEHFGAVLVDHAHCEKKAAAHALSMLQAYPEVDGLPAQMARLCREEAAHLARVLLLMEERQLSLGRDAGDPYVQALHEHVRKNEPERRLDRLLVAAIVEARSCERLGLLAEGLTDPKLRAFYRELAQSEDGHQALFYRLAVAAHGEETSRARLDFLLKQEAEILAAQELRPAIHG